MGERERGGGRPSVARRLALCDATCCVAQDMKQAAAGQEGGGGGGGGGTLFFCRRQQWEQHKDKPARHLKLEGIQKKSVSQEISAAALGNV